MEVDGSSSSDDGAAGSVSPVGPNTANGVDPDASNVDPEAVRDEVSSKGGSGGSSSSSARYKLMSPAKLPISRSPCLTIPPGLSPTSFLESPVLLSNVKAEQSPTTGSFFKPYMMHGFASSSMLSTTSGSSAPVDRSEPRGFEFQTSSRPTSFAGISMADPLASADTSNQHGEQNLLHKFVSANTTKSEAMPSSSSPVETSFAREAKPFSDPSTESGSERSSQRLNSTVEHQPPQPEHAGLTAVVNDRTSEDGYNWRKYGQKLVKGSEYPRSYYKCSHPNCEVKKLFERAPDGQITEIIYKGTHDHPKPQPTRRMPSGGSMMPIQEERSENFLSLTGPEDKPTSLPGKTRYNNDPSVNAELSPRAANENGIEGGISQVTRLSDDIDDDEDSLAKRRKMEIGGMDISSVIRPIREPRVVVQTLSDVDILDDGYRWRKYGQKVVRGNPNPRSYYKCTSIGCPVRKHVERASHDPKAVITTYEGKHNHDVPTARNNSHDASSNINSTRAQSQQDYDTVSLDLGVGLSPRSRNGSHYPQHHQTRDGTGPVLGQHQMGGSNVLFLQQLHAHPVYMNGSMMYASRENCTDGINVRNLPPLNHS